VIHFRLPRPRPLRQIMETANKDMELGLNLVRLPLRQTMETANKDMEPGPSLVPLPLRQTMETANKDMEPALNLDPRNNLDSAVNLRWPRATGQATNRPLHSRSRHWILRR
jgi:hypothetical protein